MSRESSLVVTVTIPREHFEEVLRSYETGLPDRVSFTLRGTGPDGQVSESGLTGTAAGNHVSVMDISDHGHIPLVEPAPGQTRVALVATGDNLFGLGPDIVTAAGIDRSQIIPFADQQVDLLGDTPAHIAVRQDVRALATFMVWTSMRTRAPIVCVHSSAGLDKASSYLSKAAALLPTFVRDFVPVLAVDNAMRATIATFPEPHGRPLQIPRDAISILVGSAVPGMPISWDGFPIVKLNLDKPDGRKVLAALEFAAAGVSSFGAVAFAAANVGFADEEQPDLTGPLVDEIGQLTDKVASLERRLEDKNAEVVALSRKLRKAEYSSSRTPDLPDEQREREQAAGADTTATDEPGRRADLSLYESLCGARMPASMGDVIALARQTLPHVVIPEYVDESALELDAHAKARTWAERTWRLLCAMEAFAVFHEHDSGGASFWTYCKEMPSPPMASRQIAMGESQRVETSKKWREQRTFGVPIDVHASGRLYMGAHARIGDGKPPAPRMHFYDDTRGVTGKMYVGYIGEHLHNLATSNT